MATDSSAIFNWREVTDDFKKACSDLDLGELIRQEHFGLFEAMSAIEMMDAKMDAGMQQNQRITKIKSFKQAVEDNIVKVDNFTYQEKLSIVDNTLRHLVTWIDGASLAQTLFTNMFLHDPSLVKDQYVQVFSVAVLKLIDLIRSKILIAATYEEEDFQPMHYNFKFATDTSEAEVLSLLKACEDSSAKLYRHTKGEVKPDAITPEQQLNIDLTHALWLRIKFVKSFFQLLSFSDEHASFGSKHRDDINKHITNCLDTLPKLNETSNLGIEPEIIKIGKTTFPLTIGFEPSINQRLLPPTFPRQIHIFPFDTTVNHLTDILKKIKELWDKAPELTSLDQILEFGIEFNKVHQSVFARSLFQLVVFPRNPMDRALKGKELALNSVQQFCSPPFLNSKLQIPDKSICLQLIDNFMNKCAANFICLIQTLGHNKARQRERIGHILLDFATLQDDAENLDRILQSSLVAMKIPSICFSNWVLYYNLFIMRTYLEFGFELELYSKYEYTYIYWYLSEIILNWQISNLTRVSNFLHSLDANLAQTASKNVKKAKKKKQYFEKEIALLTADKQMYTAYYQMFKAFNLENHVKSPNQEFDCEEFRFTHRFCPFQYFTTPQLVHYYQFKERDERFGTSYDVKAIYNFATSNYDAARAIYEKHSEHQKSVKISKTNTVVLKIVASGLKKVEKLDCDFSEHKYFPLIKL